MMYWPAINTVMYSAVSPKFFNLYADSACLIFAGIMSYIAYNNSNSVEVQQSASQDVTVLYKSDPTEKLLRNELDS